MLTPTRELAAQVEESVRTYGKFLQLTSTVIFGGVGMNPQISQRQEAAWTFWWPRRAACSICMQQGVLDLGQVQMLVLDEADRMLDMGFIHDVKKVLAAGAQGQSRACCSRPPSATRSATWPPPC